MRISKPSPEVVNVPLTVESDAPVPTLVETADDLGVTVEIVDADERNQGESMGVCRH